MRIYLSLPSSPNTNHLGLTLKTKCYAKCRDKDKLHKIYKTKKTLTSEIKFKTARKEFKTLIKSKI